MLGVRPRAGAGDRDAGEVWTEAYETPRGLPARRTRVSPMTSHVIGESLVRRAGRPRGVSYASVHTSPASRSPAPARGRTPSMTSHPGHGVRRSRRGCDVEV